MAQVSTIRQGAGRLHPAQRSLLLVNVLGGAAVLGSYWAGFASHTGDAGALWGGVPSWLQPFYTASMLAAAAGYFPFFHLLVFAVDPERVRVAGRFGFGLFHVLFALILVPSALWMPLTFRVVDSWDPGLWLAIRVVLATVGLASVALLAALLRLEPVPSRGARTLAVAGAALFCVQTALLDATVWTSFFPVPGAPS